MSDTKELRILVIELRKCTCHEGYASRKLHDPNCQSHSGYHDDAANGIESLLDKIEQQEALIAELRKDAARLDWLDRQGLAYGFEDIHEGNRWEIYGGYRNLRDAIDCGIKCDTSTQEVG